MEVRATVQWEKCSVPFLKYFFPNFTNFFATSQTFGLSLFLSQTHTHTHTHAHTQTHALSLPLPHTKCLNFRPTPSLSLIISLLYSPSLPLSSSLPSSLYLFLPFLYLSFSLPLIIFTSLHLFFFLFLQSLSFLPFSLSSLPLSFSRNVHYRFCNMSFKVKSNLPISSV